MKATFLGKINNFLKSNQFFIMHVLKQKMSVFEPKSNQFFYYACFKTKNVCFRASPTLSYSPPPLPPPLFSSLGHMVPGPLGNIQ